MIKNKSIWQRVCDLHKRADFPHIDDGVPQMISYEEFDFRLGFMREELAEFIEADGKGDLVGVADALADLIIVVMGTANFYHIPLDEVLTAVMNANDEKVVGKTVRAERDLIKPEGWVAPKKYIKRILGAHSQAAEEDVL